MLTVKQLQEAGARPQSYFFDKRTLRYWGDRLSNYRMVKPDALQRIKERYGYDHRVVALVFRNKLGTNVPKDILGKLYAFNSDGQVVYPDGWPDNYDDVKDLL